MSETSVALEAAPATQQSVPNISLDNFCLALSMRDKRPEMIGAFHFDERVAGHLSDTVANFQARYDAFTVKPV